MIIREHTSHTSHTSHTDADASGGAGSRIFYFLFVNKQGKKGSCSDPSPDSKVIKRTVFLIIVSKASNMSGFTQSMLGGIYKKGSMLVW